MQSDPDQGLQGEGNVLSGVNLDKMKLKYKKIFLHFPILQIMMFVLYFVIYYLCFLHVQQLNSPGFTMFSVIIIHSSF